MNEVSKEAHYIFFDVRPIFSVYEEICQVYRLPEPENILSLYDVRVRDKVRELEATYPLIEQGYPWGNVLRFDEDELQLMTDYLGMRPIITESELIDTLEYHHMLYLSNGEFRNVPVVGVW